MKIENTGQAIELIYNNIPYPNLICDLDIYDNKAIYFMWRRSKYKLEIDHCSVSMVDGGVFAGTDTAILIEHILKTALLKILTS